jgi:hypothetical protein
MKWPIVVLTIVASVAGVPRDAWAWGDEGHKVICEIAFRLVHFAIIPSLHATGCRSPNQ